MSRSSRIYFSKTQQKKLPHKSHQLLRNSIFVSQKLLCKILTVNSSLYSARQGKPPGSPCLGDSDRPFIPVKCPEIPGIIPSFFTHSRNTECYFINPEKSRNWLHSTFLYTRPDLLVTGVESVKLRTCAVLKAEEDESTSVRRACRLEVFFIPFERTMGGNW